MAVAAALVVVPMGLLFLLSGLIVNFIQAIFFVVIRPISKGLYRRINRVVAELLWLELIWLVDWWSGVKVRVYADSETFRSMGKEHALVISNHKSDIDWLVGWVLAQRSGCLGSALAVMKKSSKFLPVIGWSMWFSDYVFLERSWAKDQSTLKFGLQRLEDFPLPFWLALFVEGTRFTQAKLLAAQEYAASTGLPVPRNVLIPRTKGFCSSVSNMRTFVPAIYDVTVAIPKGQPSPTMLRILKGQPSVVHVHIERHLMKELPESDEGVAQWCRDTFVTKDSLLDKHLVEDTFGEQLFQRIDRPNKSLLGFSSSRSSPRRSRSLPTRSRSSRTLRREIRALKNTFTLSETASSPFKTAHIPVVISWSCLLLFGAFKFFKWTSLLATWKGVIFSTTALLLVTVVMHIFILFSQSERSTPAKVAPSKAEIKGSSSEPNQKKQL